MLVHPYYALSQEHPSTYLLHLQHPTARCQHFIGFSKDPVIRYMEYHRTGHYRQTREWMNKGFAITGLRVFADDTRHTYDRLMRPGRARGEHCLVCNPRVKKNYTIEVPDIRPKKRIPMPTYTG